MLFRNVQSLSCMEHHGGELCFMSSPKHDRRIQCNVSGEVNMDPNWLGWEVWRFSKTGNEGHVFISSWTHKQFFLSSSEDGHVFTTRNQESCELWKVEKNSDNGVTITSVKHNKRLKFDGKRLHTTKNDKGVHTCWHLEAANKKQFFISSTHHDRRIGCPENIQETPFVTANRKGWEVWVAQDAGNGRAVFRSKDHKNRFLGSTSKGQVVVTNDISDMNHWLLSPRPEGCLIISVYHNRYLCLNNGRELKTLPANHNIAACFWQLEPCMPHTITGEEMTKQAVATVAVISTIGLAIAAPFAILGMIGGLGFTSGGIASGSIAAGMMSAEAVAAGGGVVAGGTVATLQSIGAVGSLGAVGTTLAVGGGATIGAAVSAGAVAAVNNELDRHGTKGSEELDGNITERPFCSWRSW